MQLDIMMFGQYNDTQRWKKVKIHSPSWLSTPTRKKCCLDMLCCWTKCCFALLCCSIICFSAKQSSTICWKECSNGNVLCAISCLKIYCLKICCAVHCSDNPDHCIAMVHQQMQGLWQRRKEVSTFFDPLKHPDLSPLENDPFLLFWRGHSVKKRPLSVIPQPLQIVQD